METSHQVSLKLWSLGTNLSTSFLVLSDKLDVALDLLLASVHTSHRVSLKLRDSKKTGSLSGSLRFLVQSNELDFCPSLSSRFRIYSGEASIFRICSSSKSESGAMLSAES